MSGIRYPGGGYNALRIQLVPTRGGLVGSAWARVVRGNRTDDRLLARSIRLEGVHLDSEMDLPAVLESLAAALRAGHLTPPR